MIVLNSNRRDLGNGFTVSHLLPSAERRLVGPFIFFDYFGPVTFVPGQGIDVRPHPHIGLATVTYLFEGSQIHRDSLGSVQTIEPGAVNWMTAGKGIVHSERTGPEVRAAGHRLHGIQSWIALPKPEEEREPEFRHFAESALPAKAEQGVRMRLIAGEAYGLKSPVRVFTGMFYIDLQFDAGSKIALPEHYEERAVFIVDGALEIGGVRYTAGFMIICNPQETVMASEQTRAMFLGGNPMDGPRHIYWNFASSSKERIEKAKADWRENHFGTIPGESEFIPLPPE